MNFRVGLAGLALLVASGCLTLSSSYPTRVTEAKAIMLDGKPAVCYKLSDPSGLLGYGKDLSFYDAGYDGTLDRVEIGNGKKSRIITGENNLKPYLDGLKFAEDFWPKHIRRFPFSALRDDFNYLSKNNRN